ncbi:tellurite resistance TerB family protein [Coralliovum pocilloporae]|uniref:tellurite resistance TerB family protein n=1 Tax=Coralliovum pocilloporae TaxID=3066369 RepID=UPI003306DEFD
MIDAKKLLDGFLGGNGQGTDGLVGKGKDYLSQHGGGLAGGALAGGLAGYMLGSKKGRKLGKKAVQYGGMALVAGLAYKAYRDWQSGSPAASGQAPSSSVPQAGHTTPVAAPMEGELLPPPQGSPFDPQTVDADGASLGVKLVTAMIAAAKADGSIDAEEHRRIFEKIGLLDLSGDEKAFLMDELGAPLDITRIVESATNQEEAVEIYTASVLAIEPDHPAEQAYLQMLAARFGLEPALTEHIHAAIAVAAEPVA